MSKPNRPDHLLTATAYKAHCEANYFAAKAAQIEAAEIVAAEQAADYDYRGDIATDWRFAGWVAAGMSVLAALVAVTPA